MGRNRTQKYADFLITDAKTFEKDSEYKAKEILEEAKDREPTEGAAEVNNIGVKAEELSQDIPMGHEKLLNIAVDRLEADESDIREGGYEK